MPAESHSTRNAARPRLQLLAPPARPPRTVYVPPRRLPRRPGERREPLDGELSPPLIAAAAGRALDPRCAAELCLERAMVRADLVGLGRPDLYGRLLAVAARVTVSGSLSPAMARYLQMLLAARDRDRRGAVAPDAAAAPGAEDLVLDIPLRLFPRAAGVLDELAAADAGDLDEALALEISAVSDGRTMSEWTALAALRLSL